MLWTSWWCGSSTNATAFHSLHIWSLWTFHSFRPFSVFKSQIAYCKGPPITQVANFLSTNPVTPCLSIYNAPWYTTITSAGSYMPNTNLGFNIRCSVCEVLCFHFNSKTPTHLINDKRIRLRMQVVISWSESRVTNSFQCVRRVSKSKLG
jgi:hypothetical protein